MNYRNGALDSTITDLHRPRLSLWGRIWLSVGTGVLLLAAGAVYRFDRLSDPANQLTISPETTIVTVPLTEDGRFVDFVAALNQQLSDGVTPQNNAAVVLVEALGPGIFNPQTAARYYEMLGMPPLPSRGEYWIGEHDYCIRSRPFPSEEYVALTQRLDAQLATALTRPWSAEEFPELADWIAANDRVLDTLVAASTRTRYYVPRVPDPNEFAMSSVALPVEQYTREAARLLIARALQNAHNGESDDAWKDLLAAHRLARLMGQGGYAITDIMAARLDEAVCIADHRLLSLGRIDAELVRRIAADLNSLTPVALSAPTWDVGERYAMMDTIERAIQGDPGFTEYFVRGGDGSISPDLLNAAIDWNVALSRANGRFDEIVKALRQPLRRDRGASLEQCYTASIDSLQGSVRGNLTLLTDALLRGRYQLSVEAGDTAAMMLGHSADKSDVTVTSGHAHLELVRICYAIELYHDRHGELPPSLDQVSSDIAPWLPLDPFSGESFIYRPANVGRYLLYSVGENLADDGGAGDDLALEVAESP